MRAFLSDSAGRPETTHYPHRCAAGVYAESEVKRILAETEDSISPTPLRSLARLTSQRPSPDGSRRSAKHALADSLTAVLPVLDELALDASLCALGEDGWQTVAIADRNRATLATLETEASQCGACGGSGYQRLTHCHVGGPFACPACL
jgi:hypothetical protein